jgi:hypothetical protein
MHTAQAASVSAETSWSSAGEVFVSRTHRSTHRSAAHPWPAHLHHPHLHLAMAPAQTTSSSRVNRGRTTRLEEFGTWSDLLQTLMMKRRDEGGTTAAGGGRRSVG